ncbi:PKD domain-containing protein [Marinibacterium profundimaris]|nr:PKD domain-containing protein [Marinibacterium profundimaris]
MGKARRIPTVLASLGLALTSLALIAPREALAQAGGEPGLMVVYGALTPSREGDVDLREQVFFSVPADMRERLYVRVYDPEVHGASDFALGGTANSLTTFRLFGGSGAFSEADRPVPVEDGARVPNRPDATPVTGPGALLEEKSWGNDRATDGRWVTLAALRAGQGEVIDGRAYFRIDVQGAGGDDGNGFSVAVSLARDRNRRPAGLEMFSYMPTLRWSRGEPATMVPFTGPGAGPLTVQSFDAANGSITVTTEFEDLPVRVSGQNFWTSDVVETAETDLAITLLNGFETPNDVTVAVYDAEGHAIPLRMPPIQAPIPLRPEPMGSASPLADCRSVAFDASRSSGRGPLSYLWDFGDGGRSAEPVIAYRYAKPGRYTARLEVVEPGTRPGRGAAIEVPVHVRNAPVAVPGSDIVVAPGELLDFDGTGSIPSDSPITRYRWTFGDGALAEGPQAQKIYDTPGLYRAVLRVEDGSNHPCNFGVETRRVIVNFPPVAEAGTDQTAVVGKPVIFSGAASYDVDGNVETFEWNLGDGTVLTGPTVTHTYQDPGRFRVALTVKDDSGVANDASVDTMLVEVNAPPQPAFQIPPRPVSVSEVARLDASASTDADGAILSWIWDFGDGRSGEGETVDYAWTRSGTFTVTLTVIDDSGTASSTQSSQRQIVIDDAPVAEAGPDQFVTASEVTFDGGGSTDSDGTVTSWQWDFGDGSTGTGKTITHAYARPGTYEVALVVRDDSTAPLNLDRDTMRVIVNAAPIADAGPPQVVAPGEAFILSGRASVDPDGEVVDYAWDLPGGAVASGERVSHAIAEPGLHRIRLTVSDDFRGGAAQDEAETLITVNARPVAVAGADILVAPGDTVTFDGSQSFDPDGEIATWRWEFDDLGAPLEAVRVERAYETAGVWSAQLIVTDDSGVMNATATDALTIRVNHQPVAEAGAAIDTDRLIVTLDGSGSSDADGDKLIYTWDYGDGSAPETGQVVTHVFPRSGIYPVTLRVDDGTGMANATAADATTVEINTRPVADAGGNRAVCSGEPILFDASDSVDPDGGLLLYSWDFGDGTTSDLVNPTKTYEFPGIYPVTLRIANETGTEHGTDVDRIAALVREGPLANAGPDMTVCTNQSVRFDGSGSTDADGAVNAFAWTFGDGGIGNGEQPVYVYDKPGDYIATLTITGEARGNCSPLDTDTAAIRVVAAPEQAIEGFERAAAGQPATFSAALSQLDGAVPVAHRWQLSNGVTGAGETFTHVFEEPGDYLITVSTDLAGGNEGCSTIETLRKVLVNAAPQPVIQGPEQIAVGQSVSFDASATVDPDGAITAYAWDFGDGGSATGVVGTHVWEVPGRYDVQLVVTDDADVGNSVVPAVRSVLVNPAPVAALPETPAICPGEALSWKVAADASTTVEWDFGDGTTGTGNTAEHAFAAPGLYPVVARMNDGTGLLNAQRSEESYVRVNRAPRALAGPDRVICPGDEVTFDAGLSGDLDGEITGWTWAFGDGVTLEGAQVSRVFETAGPVSVTLTVRDDSGSACATGVDEAMVLVNRAPRVDAGPDVTVPVGAAHDVLRFDASGASDADGQGLRIGWAFGDGREATGAIARHAYAAPGEYVVEVTARDTTGLACGVATDTAIVTAVPRE